MTVCTYCKGELAEGATKCQHCGEWVDKASARKASGELPPVVKIVAVVVMVLIAYWFVFYVVF